MQCSSWPIYSSNARNQKAIRSLDELVTEQSTAKVASASEIILFNLATLQELHSVDAAERKQEILQSSVARWAHDDFSADVLRLPVAPPPESIDGRMSKSASTVSVSGEQLRSSASSLQMRSPSNLFNTPRNADSTDASVFRS